MENFIAPDDLNFLPSITKRVQAHFHNAMDVVGDCHLILVGEDLSTIFFNETLIKHKRLEGQASKFVFVIHGKVQIIWCDGVCVNGETSSHQTI